MENKNKWIDVQTKLKDLSNRDLKNIIKELYRLNRETKDFLEAKFCHNEDILLSCKDKIRKYLEPSRNEWKRPELAKAKTVIRSYKKATGDDKGTIEIMVHYYDLISHYQYQYGPNIYVESPAHSIFKDIIIALDNQKADFIRSQVEKLLKINKKWYDRLSLDKMINQLIQSKF